MLAIAALIGFAVGAIAAALVILMQVRVTFTVGVKYTYRSLR